MLTVVEMPLQRFYNFIYFIMIPIINAVNELFIHNIAFMSFYEELYQLSAHANNSE